MIKITLSQLIQVIVTPQGVINQVILLQVQASQSQKPPEGKEKTQQKEIDRNRDIKENKVTEGLEKKIEVKEENKKTGIVKRKTNKGEKGVNQNEVARKVGITINIKKKGKTKRKTNIKEITIVINQSIKRVLQNRRREVKKGKSQGKMKKKKNLGWMTKRGKIMKNVIKEKSQP